MRAVAIHTPIVKPGENLVEFLKKHLPQPEEKTILVITSKIISYAQNRLLPIPKNEINDPKVSQAIKEAKDQLIREEADFYLEASSSKYDVMLTIKNTLLAVNSGLDESNANGNYVLWPEDLQEVTNEFWQELRAHYDLKQFGVIVTDSQSMPLRWGVMGSAVATCGFHPLIDRIGSKDIFGKELEMTKMSVAEGVAAAAVFEMGEGDEQRPVALVSDFQQPIVFMDRPLTEKELESLTVEPEDDVYAPVLKSVAWNKGGGGKKL